MFSFFHHKLGPASTKDREALAPPLTEFKDPLPSRQGLNKAGIIVTKELEGAIDRCRTKVQRIAKECRRNNRRFRDRNFDLLDDKYRCLHGLPTRTTSEATYYEPMDALRVNQIFDKPEFFINGATASDISQGSIGDCWFLSGLSLVATAGLVEKICVERDEQVGVYGFIFWRDAGWVDVIVDDLLFVNIPKWREVDEPTRMLYKYDQDTYMKLRRGSKILYFSQSITENETWVPLLEKAYAKLHGDYAALEGGLTYEAIEDLSGAVSNWMYIKDTLDPDYFWHNELLHANEDRLFACSMIVDNAVKDVGDRWRDPLNGLLAQHAYSVVKAFEYNGKRFVKIRNPWGMHEWQGRWSDGSKEWEGEWLDAIKEMDYKFGHDGEFLMEYSDFLTTWDSVERCRLFDNKWALSQLWLQVPLGEYPRPTNFGDVSFTISVSEPTSAVVVLSQIDTRYFLGVNNLYRFSLHFAIFKAGERETVVTSYHDALWRRSVNVEVDFEEGDYVVHVMVDRVPPVSYTPYNPRPLPNPTPGPADPNYTTPAVPELSGMAYRKMTQKKAEMLLSASVAANFRPADYGVSMPLAEDLYHGVDLTSMELAMYDMQRNFEEMKKKAFRVKEKDEAKEEEGGAREEKEEGKRRVLATEKGEETLQVDGGDGDGDDKQERKSEDAADAGKEIQENNGLSTQTVLVDTADAEQPNEQAPQPSEVTSATTASSPSDIDAAKNVDEKKKEEVKLPDQPASDKAAHFTETGKHQEKKNDPIGDEEKPQSQDGKGGASGSPSPTPSPGPSNRRPSPEASKPAHGGYTCDGCGGLIYGSRFRCLDIKCPEYDLCEACAKLEVHDPSHRMLEVKEYDESLLYGDPPSATSEEVITLGLRVYASKECMVNIKGQLRHKNMIRNYVTMAKIM